MLATIQALAVASALLGPLTPGPHAVGFRFIVEMDTTRPVLPPEANGSGRPVPIAVWYPAQPTAVAPLRLRDYVALGAQALTGTMPADPREPIEAFISDALRRGLSRDDLDRLLDTATDPRRGG
jgi:hypothetical protein